MSYSWREEHLRDFGCPTCRAGALERRAKTLRNRELCFAVPAAIMVAMGLVLLALRLVHDHTDLRTVFDHDGNGAILACLIGGGALAIPALFLHRLRRKVSGHWH